MTTKPRRFHKAASYCGSTPAVGVTTNRPIAERIITEEFGPSMSPEETMIWEILYQTIVDCYMVARGKWRHFVCMRWHKDYKKYSAERYLSSAREHITEWINSDTFADYLWVMGWEAGVSKRELQKLMDGNYNIAEVREMINQIGKERDSRRVRKELCDG